MQNFTGFYDSPIGVLKITIQDDAICKLDLVDSPSKISNSLKHDVFEKASAQLDQYFEGVRKEFDLPLSLRGTEFQRRVWAELLNIPYGTRKSYKDIAARLGDCKKSRAVGMANNRNPVPLIVPCHRVVASNGSLSGYSLGVAVKAHLLAFESASERFVAD